MGPILAFIAPILAVLSAKFGAIGVIGAYLIFLAPVVSLLIEIAEALVMLSASQKDDAELAKVKAVWVGSILPVIEIFPHVNLPIAPLIVKLVLYLTKGTAAAKAAVDAWNKA